jgi:hypothetical protein
MFDRKGAWILGLGIVLMVVGANVDAQQTVYKWVDEDGVVHFSDEPPVESEAVKIETITTAKPRPYEPPTQPAVKLRAAPEGPVEKRSAEPNTDTSPPIEQIDVKKMSLAELDRRCEDAREAKIAPLREAEIAKCKQTETTDPARCERFYADFGAGGRTISGGTLPRMFHDLPECLEAEQERRRRASRTPAENR